MQAAAVRVPGAPGGAIVSADSRFAYRPVMETLEVAVVDLFLLTVVRRIPVGAAPDGMALARR